MSQTLASEAEFTGFIQRHQICSVYFSGPDCTVCKTLKPKLFEMLNDRFPAVAIGEVDCAVSPQLAAQQVVFSIPTMIIYIEGREAIRKVRSFSPSELALELERPYTMIGQPRSPDGVLRNPGG